MRFVLLATSIFLTACLHENGEQTEIGEIEGIWVSECKYSAENDQYSFAKEMFEETKYMHETHYFEDSNCKTPILFVERPVVFPMDGSYSYGEYITTSEGVEAKRITLLIERRNLEEEWTDSVEIAYTIVDGILYFVFQTEDKEGFSVNYDTRYTLQDNT